ncbi:MAG: hypothetical protein U0359_37490 [Byssovorax sp.]
MRVKIVTLLLLSLLGALGALLIVHGATPHRAPAPPAVHAGSGEPAASAAGSASASAAGSSSAPPADAGPPKLIDRPLRVVALGWDLGAAGVLANGGLDPAPNSDFSAAGVETHIAVVDAMPVVEGALARGGGDKDGADIALVPFSHFVAATERLRALSPEAFFVIGWSRGREALLSSKEGLPAPDAKGEAKELKMVGSPGDPATFLGLFALDAAGVPLTAVRLVGPETRSDDAILAAIDRDATPPDPARRFVLLTSADASRLVPFVAVAQHGLVDRSKKGLAVWARTWLDGMKKLGSDPPAAARQIAQATGAPEPIALLKRLGQITPATLTDNARLAGLSGRGALTLDSLFQRSFRIWRASGALATPAPDAAPVSTQVIASLARSNPELIQTPTPRPAANGSAADTARAMITFRMPEGKFDEGELGANIAFFADVFERSALRVAVNKGQNVDAAATKHLIDLVDERFDSAGGRVIPAKKALPKVGASVEILPAP